MFISSTKIVTRHFSMLLDLIPFFGSSFGIFLRSIPSSVFESVTTIIIDALFQFNSMLLGN